jgi:integration host factor subunit alpha
MQCVENFAEPFAASRWYTVFFAVDERAFPGLACAIGGAGPLFIEFRKERGMAGHTVTRAELAEAVYQQVGLSRNESASLVEAVLEEMAAALERGETVKISSFGSFGVRKKGERIGRNPKTGEEVPITPRRVLVFRASHVLKDRINIEHQ